jgi:hypothetical protein
MKRLYDRCDKELVKRFARAYCDYCSIHDINMAAVERSILGKGKSNMYPGKISDWRCGKIDRPVYVYTLNVLCEEIGLKLLDFVSVSVPSSSPRVSPELMRKRKKIV